MFSLALLDSFSFSFKKIFYSPRNGIRGREKIKSVEPVLGDLRWKQGEGEMGVWEGGKKLLRVGL